MSREVLPWTWGAFVVAAVTGVLLFATNPVKYFANEAFRWKFAWMAIAGLNMLIFQLITYRGVSRWDRDAAVPVGGQARRRHFARRLDRGRRLRPLDRILDVLVRI